MDKLNVLFFDDDKSMLEIIEVFLAEDVNVFLAPSVDDFISTLGQQNIHCIVSDVQMPGHDGLDLLEHIRAVMPYFPVIIFSAYGNETLQKRSKQLKADAFVVKPEFDHLKEEIEKIVVRNDNLSISKEVKESLIKFFMK